MTVEHREVGNASTHTNTVMTECPFCHMDLPDGMGFSKHWANCEVNQ